jgi:hypothetical protein
MSSQSSRWLQKDFFVCGLCNTVQKHIRGYKPIPNPVLFNAADSCRAYARETQDSVGYVDHQLMKKCDGCKTLHGSWNWIDFQDAMKRKETKFISASGSKK